MTNRHKVVITDLVRDAMEDERAILDDVADVVALDGSCEEDLHGGIEDADAVMVYHCLAITEKTIERLERCRLIVRCGVGVDNVDVEAARRRGIPVANVPDYGTEEVADSAVGMLLTLARGVHLLNSVFRRRPAPWTHEPAVPLRRLRGTVLGIVGLGRIGTAVAIRGKALGMDVAYYDPYKQDGYDKALGVRRVRDLNALVAESHVLTLHCPLTSETRHIVDAETLSRMPADSFLVNTARGALVQTDALADAVARGPLAGAAIDVFPEEPPRDGDPLIAAWRDPQHPAHDRILINPHAAWYCDEGLVEMRTKSAHACRAAILGHPIPNVVNDIGDRPRRPW